MHYVIITHYILDCRSLQYNSCQIFDFKMLKYVGLHAFKHNEIDNMKTITHRPKY